ncbi:MAG: DNA polymerase IV [Candidatus Eisenbacteria bacterium]|nr:DNA polymerase IV [Candidatus Eisenbacteria bacterium]
MILHVDIDAFFAQVEQLRYPPLRGRPVIVGAGVIASCSYEARRHGLRAGMRLSEARRRCPGVVILEGSAQTYRCFAEAIFELCGGVSGAVESYLDEAYLDLAGTERYHGDPVAAAARLKERIRREVGLTVSVGIGPNRMLAKLACKIRRPDGLNHITAGEAPAFLEGRPVEDLPGVGPRTARRLRGLNITTVAALRAVPREALARLLGAAGEALHERSHGRDTRAVGPREIPGSVSRETSFHSPATDTGEIEGMLGYLAGRLGRALRELGLAARTVGCSMRTSDGQGDTRSRTLAEPTDLDSLLFETARDLLRRMHTRRVALHLVGVRATGLGPAGGRQGRLFDADPAREASLLGALDEVRGRFGHGAVVSGGALHLLGRLEQNEHGFVLRTPSLTK